MAGILAVLRAVGRLAVRDLKSLNSLGTNNFFLFCLLIGPGGLFLTVLIGLLLLFPLSADPLRRVPKSRWSLWPFAPLERAAIRAGSFALSPGAWITAVIVVVLARPAVGLRFAALSIGVGAATVALSALAARVPNANPLLHIPPVPGRFGGLVRKNLREMLSVLDVYVALLLALCGVAFRLSGQLDADARMGVTLLIVLALSTYAQLLFGLDSDSGLTRYALLPLRGWTILAAKDAAFLLLLLPLVVFLSPLAGLAAALMALAFGHHVSVEQRIPQHRWRFTGGGTIVFGAIQAVAMFSAGVMTAREAPWFILPCAAAYAGSLAWYGRRLEIS